MAQTLANPSSLHSPAREAPLDVVSEEIADAAESFSSNFAVLFLLSAHPIPFRSSGIPNIRNAFGCLEHEGSPGNAGLDGHILGTV